MLGRPWGRTKITLAISFLIMILLQLVNLQIRDYNVRASVKPLITLEYFGTYLDLECQKDPDSLLGIRYPALGDTSTTAHKVLASWMISPGSSWINRISCKNGLVSTRLLLIWNQYFLIATIILLILTTRFLTSSWMVSLTVGAAMINRDILVERVGILGIDNPMMFFFTLWFAGTVHFFKTGAVGSLVVSAFAIAGGATFDFAFGVLGLGVPLLVLVGYFFRQQQSQAIRTRIKARKKIAKDKNRGRSGSGATNDSFGNRIVSTMKWMVGQGVPETPAVDFRRNIERGSLFRVINVPFGYWVYRKSRWRKLTFGWIAASIAIALGVFGLFHLGAGRIAGGRFPDFLDLGSHLMNLQWVSFWFVELMAPFDIYYILSFAIIVVCAAQSPADGLTSYFESVWGLIFACLVVLVSVFLFDMIDQSVIAEFQTSSTKIPTMKMPARNFFIWTEPIFLTLGIAGVYNLIKVADSRLAENWKSVASSSRKSGRTSDSEKS